MSNLFTGERVRLTAADPDTAGEYYAKWSHDSEFMQLWDSDAPQIRDVKKTQEYFRKEAEKENPGNFPFMVQRIEDGRYIGMTGLWDAFSSHKNAWVSIGIGDRDLWSQGYGTEAMDLTLDFAFGELNLHRVNLLTFSFNPRAIRSYEKIGFVHEGRMRGRVLRYRERHDFVYMGILRGEWQARHDAKAAVSVE